MKKNSRNYEIILYSEVEVNRIVNLCLLNGFDYAFILHDKDLKEDLTEYKKIHYHFQIYMYNQKTISALSKLLDVKENYIQYIRDKKSAIRYLCHADNNEKAKYEIFEIKSNMDLAPYFNNLISNETIELEIIIDYINRPKLISKIDLFHYVLDNNIWSTYRRNYSIISDYISEHNLLFTKSKNGDNIDLTD